jgi:arylsulfatase A-like enzyme
VRGRRAQEAPAPLPTPPENPAPEKPANATVELEELPRSLPRSKSKRPNVVFIVLDTVRVDHLSCYGYRRDTTPNLDAFAAGARQYKNVLSPSPWTGPSHASMFTGLPVSAHGCDWLHRCLDERFATLAGQLTAHGYQTVGLSSNAMLSATPGMTRGFQSFWVPPDGIFKGAADHMHNRLALWFGKEYDAEKPFFLFMNYIEAHQPYSPTQASLRFVSSEILTRWSREDQVSRSFNYTLLKSNALSSQDIAELETLYDDEISYIDRMLGEIFAFLKSTGFEDNTAVIVSSDHSEHFGEHHRMSHQYSLYDLTNDPLETRNLADQKPAVARELSTALDSWAHSFEPYVARSTPQSAQPQPMSPNEIKAMRGLGYVH